VGVFNRPVVQFDVGIRLIFLARTVVLAKKFAFSCFEQMLLAVKYLCKEFSTKFFGKRFFLVFFNSHR
jgi:hypothetical protein